MCQLVKNCDRALVEVGHRVLHQRRGQRVAAGGGKPEQCRPRLAPGARGRDDQHGLEDRGGDEHDDPARVLGGVDGAAWLGDREPRAERGRGERDGGPGQSPERRAVVIGERGEHQRDRQLDDEDRLYERDRAGRERGGLGHRRHDDHADAGEPHPALDEIGDQRDVHGPLGRNLGRRLALQDRGAGIAPRGEQREQDAEQRVHPDGMQVHVDAGLVQGGHAGLFFCWFRCSAALTRSANGRRLARLSPRFSRHAHSRRMAEAKPILSASLNVSSE